MKLTQHCVSKWATRATFVAVLITQVATLTQYLARYEGKSSFQAFVLLYVPAIALWAKGQCRDDRSRIVAAGVWVLYLVPLGVETGWILGRLLSKIDEDSLLDSGFLKYVLSLASVVFMTLESEDVDLQLTSAYTWLRVVDVLDAVDLLGVLLDVDRASSTLPSSVRIAIITSTLLSVFSLTFALTESVKSLPQNREANTDLPTVVMIYFLMQTLLVNFPFLVTRLVLHYKYEQNSSVFAFKNVLMILLSICDMCFNCCCKTLLSETARTETSSRGRSAQPSVGDTDESLSTVSSGRRQTDATRRTERRNGRLLQAADPELIEEFV